MPGQTILIIDDSKVQVARTARELAKAGYNSISADNGYSGIELAIRSRPAVVLCDYTLPGMCGDRVVEELRGNPVTARIPVVIYSSQADAALIEECMRAGAAGLVQKTGDYAALVAKIRDVLGETDFEVEF
ncbi:MAG: response regulator [Acidobacteriota bacterium]